MKDKLVNISVKDLPTLRDLYKVYWPQYNVGYGTIDTYIRWLSEESNIPHLQICSLNGDWSDGTFIVTDWDSIYANTLSTDYTRLTKVLSLLDYSKGYTLASIEPRLYNVVHKFIEEHQLPFRSVTPTKLYRLSHSEASKLTVEPPEGIVLKPLTEDNMVLANSLWSLKHPGSLISLKRLVKRNVSVGAFTSDGELVAWCLRFQAGGLATLQVVDSYKRKGLGELIVRAISKAVGDTGYDVFAPIVVTNTPSFNLFEKLGFKELFEMWWFPPSINTGKLSDDETQF